MSGLFVKLPAISTLGGISLPPGGFYAKNLSPKWVKPSNVFTVDAPDLRGHGFQGRDFIGQFTMKYDEYGDPLREICGTMTYRNMDSHVDGMNPGDPAIWDENLSRNYVFTTTPGSEAVNLVTSGDVTGFPAANTGSIPEYGTYHEPWGDDGEMINVGYVRKYNEVTFNFLDGVMATWVAQSRDFHDATIGSVWWGNGFALRSESPAGSHCYVTGIMVYDGGQDLTPDTVVSGKTTVYGYDPAYTSKLALVRRKNQPVVTDFGPPPSFPNETGLAAYRSGNVGKKLMGLITQRKWKDAIGTYDRRTDAAFLGISYEEVSGYDLYKLLPNASSSSTDRTSRLLLVSADGGTYRITMTAGTDLWTESAVSVREDVIDLPPGAGVEVSYDAVVSGATHVRITKVEALEADSSYSEIVMSISGSPTISDTPLTGTRILMGIIVRSGSRWGHGPYSSESFPDYNDRSRYLTERIFKNLKAETIT